MIINTIAILIAALATIPCVVLFINLRSFRRTVPHQGNLPPISVLIPARDEEHAITDAIRSVLDHADGLDLELLVLDDHSTDRTAERVLAIAAHDPRVRLIHAPPLPNGWFGKPHACQQLAEAAQHDTLLWLDADVRLLPGGLHHLAAALHTSKATLISTVPRQITRTHAETLVIPQILFVLLGYLPMFRMRRSTSPAYGAACGQLMIARRDAYLDAGGHAAVRNLMHESLALARMFRRAGHPTDLIDGTRIATCRMYHAAAEVWHGFAKNAHEGMATPAAILPWTLLLLGAQPLPWLLALLTLTHTIPHNPITISAAIVALIAAITTSLTIALAFRQGVTAALVRPLGILVLIAIQWHALIRHLAGHPVTWRGRAYAPSSP